MKVKGGGRSFHSLNTFGRKDNSNCLEERGPPGTWNRNWWLAVAKRVERANFFGNSRKERSTSCGACSYTTECRIWRGATDLLRVRLSTRGNKESLSQLRTVRMERLWNLSRAVENFSSWINFRSFTQQFRSIYVKIITWKGTKLCIDDNKGHHIS